MLSTKELDYAILDERLVVQACHDICNDLRERHENDRDKEQENQSDEFTKMFNRMAIEKYGRRN